MRLDILFFESVGPFCADITPNELEAILGPAEEHFPVHKLDNELRQRVAEGEVNWMYPHSTFYFVQDQLKECAFAEHQQNQLYLDGVNLDWTGNFVAQLKNDYPQYVEDVGFIEFVEIGLSLADFFDAEAEKVIRIFLDKEFYERPKDC
ncbi:MAG: hypothetical protein ABJ308_13875 [Halieaceae bacterium]